METSIQIPPHFKLHFHHHPAPSSTNLLQPSYKYQQQVSKPPAYATRKEDRLFKAHRKKSIPKKRRKSSESHNPSSSDSSSSQSDSQQESLRIESPQYHLGESSNLRNSDEEEQSQTEQEDDDNQEESEAEESQDKTWTPKSYKKRGPKVTKKYKSIKQTKFSLTNPTRNFPPSDQTLHFHQPTHQPKKPPLPFKIVAAMKIEKGTLIPSTLGEGVTVFLDTNAEDSPENVRFAFGCLDKTIPLPPGVIKNLEKAKIEEQETAPEDEDSTDSLSPGPLQRKAGSKEVVRAIRQTNWIRFVRHSVNYSDGEINFIGQIQNGKVVYEATKNLQSGMEIVVYFDIDSLKHNLQEGQEETLRKFNQSAPLDLSAALPSSFPPTFSAALFKSSETQERPPLGSSAPAFDSILRNHHFNPRMSYPFTINDVLAATHPSLYSPPLFKSPYSHHHPFQSSTSSKGEATKSFHPSTFPHSSQSPLFLSSLIKTSMEEPKLIQASSSLHRHALLHHEAGSAEVAKAEASRSILRNRGRERSLLPCEVCGKTFDRPSLLKRHMRTHTGEKPHICDVCSKGFSTSSSLNTHRRIHSGEKPHQCPICGKRFTASSNLYYHRMTHNKEKPHKCVLCAKSFPTPGDLKSHQYVHSGSWPYNCPVCHRGFSKQTNLRNHLLLHSGDKPHNCQMCGKKFALACNLRAHLRTHEEDSTSSCVSCSRSFLTTLNMLDSKGRCQACILHAQNHHHHSHSTASRTLTTSSLTSFRSLATSSESFKPGSAPSPSQLFPSVYLSPPPLPTLHSSPPSSSSSSSSCFITMENHSTESKKSSSVTYGNAGGNRRSSHHHPHHHHKPPKTKESSQSSNKSQILPSTPPTPDDSSIPRGRSASSSANPIIPPHLLHFFTSSSPFGGNAMLGETLPPPHFQLSHLIPPDSSTYPDAPSSKSNPLLEQWFKWQWLLANEANLGGFHKKLIESQMLATQIMSVSLKTSQSDILNLR